MPRRVTPTQLQAEVLRGYARFYSLGRWLSYLARRDWVSLRNHTWCWWFARHWARDGHNRRYLEELARLPLAREPQPTRLAA